jgi:hypothetical protein
VDRYARLLSELASGAGLDAPSFNLTSKEAEATLAELDGELYLSHSRVRKYVLLRLDELLSADDGPIFQHKLVTIEHVLPQNPPADSQWTTQFTQEQRELWTNRLANLVLLNRYKNSVAGNLDFEQKKAKYFTGKSGVMTYALTLGVLGVSEWTPKVLRDRQDQLLGMLSEAWGLGKNPLVVTESGPYTGKDEPRQSLSAYRDMVLDYFAKLPAGELRAVRHVEEDLQLPNNTLSNLLNLLATGENSPLVTKPGPYTGDGESRQALYKCYARRA